MTEYTLSLSRHATTGERFLLVIETGIVNASILAMQQLGPDEYPGGLGIENNHVDDHMLDEPALFIAAEWREVASVDLTLRPSDITDALDAILS